MTDNDIETIATKIASLHEKILKSKFAEQVFESEMLCLILAIQGLREQKAEIKNLEIELKAMRGAANSYKADVERLRFNLECLLKERADQRRKNESVACKRERRV